jgi:hypothetical protein
LPARPENKEVFLLKKSEKILKTKLKGAVLLLVMTVMFMLMILLMATLAVVSSSNKKAYVKFEENQAYYTAASALEVFWNGGVLADSKFISEDASGALKDYVKPDGTTSADVLTQGRDLELELYKLKPITNLGIAADYPFVASRIDGGNVNDLVKYLQEYTGDASTPNGMGGDTAGKYSKQFEQPTSAENALAYYIEFPSIVNPTDSAAYGRYADENPNASVSGAAKQMASIKIEVIERYYDLAGVTQADLEAFLTYDPADYPASPLPGDPTPPVPPAAIAEDVVAPAVATKIDPAKVKTALQGGDRAKDYFKIRITSESMLMGVKGSAAIELKTGAAVQSAPQGDTAIKSFGFTEDGSAGYNAVGGASGLADISLNVSVLSGMAYSEGNVKHSGSAKLMTENSMRYNASNNYIESKPHVFAKSWISSPSADMDVSSQSEEMFVYGGKGIYNGTEIYQTSDVVNYITNGTFYNGRTDYNVTGNLVMGEYGKGEYHKSAAETDVNKSVFIRDLYFDDFVYDPYAWPTPGWSGLRGDSFAMKPKLEIGKTSGNKTLYVKDLYLTFPADYVKDPSTAVTSWHNGVNTLSEAAGGDTTNIGYYDETYELTAGKISPIRVDSAGTAKWAINTNFDTSKFSELVFSGKVYFRDYNGTASYDDDTWVGWEWDDINGSDNSSDTDDWFWFVGGKVGDNSGGKSLGYDNSLGETDRYYRIESAEVLNGDMLKYAAPTDTSVFVPGTDSEYAWDINPDVNNAIRGTYTGVDSDADGTPDPAGAGAVYFTSNDADDAPVPEVKNYNTSGASAVKAANVSNAAVAPYVFDTEKGHIYLSMPFRTSDNGIRKARAILKCDTPMSLYKEYFTSATYNVATAPIDGNNNGYLTYNPALPSNPDVLGYGMVTNGYVGPFKYTSGATSTASKYDLPADTTAPNSSLQMNGTQSFGYIFKQPESPASGVTYGIGDLIQSAESRAGSAAFALTNVIFDNSNIPTSMSTMDIAGRSIKYTDLLDSSGVVKPLTGSSLQQSSKPSLVNVIDATTSAQTIVLEPDGNIIAGTYFINGDKAVNFIIKESATPRTLTFGAGQQRALNIISSKNLQYFATDGRITGNSQAGEWGVDIAGMESLLGAGATINTGSNASATDKATSSLITVYVGKGNDIELKAGCVDGTLYAPNSRVTFASGDQMPSLDVKFNTETPAQKNNETEVAILGTIICSTLKFDSESQVVFVASDSDDAPAAGVPQFSWNPIAYMANAAGS